MIFLLITLLLISLSFCFIAIRRRAEVERVKGQKRGSTAAGEGGTIARVYEKKNGEEWFITGSLFL